MESEEDGLSVSLRLPRKRDEQTEPYRNDQSLILVEGNSQSVASRPAVNVQLLLLYNQCTGRVLQNQPKTQILH